MVCLIKNKKMKSFLKIILSLSFFTFAFSYSKAQKEQTEKIKNSQVFKENNDLKFAESELKNALIKNEVLSDKVISDSQTAVDVAEIVLFKIYGKNNIIKQRPYDVNFTENHYVINGTLPQNMKGGTFLIILNSKDGKIIKLTHGK